jgi:hypothetical protein
MRSCGPDGPNVSLAAGVLQKKELIEYTRGAVKIVNRKQLEDSACHGVIRQYDGGLGFAARAAGRCHRPEEGSAGGLM